MRIADREWGGGGEGKERGGGDSRALFRKILR